MPRLPLIAALLAASAALAAQPAVAKPSASDPALQPKNIELHMRIAHPAAGKRIVALTFDACMGAFDTRIADALIRDHAAATIFVTHRWLKNNAAATALLLAHPDLFEIENHGDQHIPAITDQPTIYGLKTAGSLAAVKQEVDGGADAIVAATGQAPRWYRDASAVYSPDAIAAIHADGYQIAGFSVNADVGASLPSAEVTKRLMAAKDGDVIIGHINQPKHPAGAGWATGIDRLAASGATFVKLDQVSVVDTK